VNSITPIETKDNLAIVQVIPLDQNPAAVYLAGLSNEKARRVQADALSRISAMLTGSPDYLAVNWAAIRFQHMQAIRAKLAEHYKPASANRMLSALRGTLRAAFLLGFMGAEDYQRAIMVKPVTGSTIPAGRELTSGELAALMQACENDPGPGGVRDAALIAILYSCGLRREEAVNLDLADYDPGSGKLVVFGKRSKERVNYVINGAQDALADWMVIRGSDPGPLFWPVTKSGLLTNRRMTTQAIYNMLTRRALDAGVKHFSPHDLRRTFVGDLLGAGADIATVAKMAGHSSVNTTARYDRRPEIEKQKAAELLHVPYRRRLV